MEAGDAEGQLRLARVLGALTKAVGILGLLSATFGPAYSYTVLRIIYSTKVSRPQLCQLYAMHTHAHLHPLLHTVHGSWALQGS